MRNYLLMVLLFGMMQTSAQTKNYTTSNAHSHNDYEQAEPFWMAYRQGFGSIEADVFLRDNELMVAHETKDIHPSRTLKSLYLEPLRQCVEKNNGSIYADKKKKLVLLIDCKTEGLATLNSIIEQLQSYPLLTRRSGIQFVITGNRPHKDSLHRYPSYILFDGDLLYDYQPANLKKIGMFSGNFENFVTWRGTEKMDDASKQKLLVQIRKAHRLGKPVRFWAAPDHPEAWKTLMHLGADFINTDKIDELASFIRENKSIKK